MVKETLHLADARGPVGIKKAYQGRLCSLQAGDDTPAFSQAVVKPEAPYRQIGPACGDLVHDLGSPVIPVADDDEFSVKPANLLEERYDPVLLVIGRDNKAAGN